MNITGKNLIIDIAIYLEKHPRLHYYSSWPYVRV